MGTTTAALFALSGHNVTALDIDPNKVKIINKGQAPFFEAGLNETIIKGIDSKSLTATTDYKLAIQDADFIFSCVGTPDKLDGSSDLDFIFEAAKTAAKYLKPGSIYVQKSTVPVGTGRKVQELLPRNTTYISNPEFLRESTAIYDTLLFDRVVVGGDNIDAVKKVLGLYKDIEENSKAISQVAQLDILDELSEHTGQYIITNLESAELIKVTANAFLALKISFANSIAKLADVTGADINEVMNAVGADPRIGRAFLNAGRGYGGGCFPKDVSGLIASAAEHKIDMQILKAATEVNNSMPSYIINRVKAVLGESLQDKKMAVFGLSFKAGTSDARKSPGISLANLLYKAGAVVSVYDPHAIEEASTELQSGIRICESAFSAAHQAEAILIATAWPEFKDMNLAKLKETMVGTFIYDADNALVRKTVANSGLTYMGVGKS